MCSFLPLVQRCPTLSPQAPNGGNTNGHGVTTRFRPSFTTCHPNRRPRPVLLRRRALQRAPPTPSRFAPGPPPREILRLPAEKPALKQARRRERRLRPRRSHRARHVSPRCPRSARQSQVIASRLWGAGEGCPRTGRACGDARGCASLRALPALTVRASCVQLPSRSGDAARGDAALYAELEVGTNKRAARENLAPASTAERARFPRGPSKFACARQTQARVLELR